MSVAASANPELPCLYASLVSCRVLTKDPNRVCDDHQGEVLVAFDNCRLTHALESKEKHEDLRLGDGRVVETRRFDNIYKQFHLLVFRSSYEAVEATDFLQKENPTNKKFWLHRVETIIPEHIYQNAIPFVVRRNNRNKPHIVVKRVRRRNKPRIVVQDMYTEGECGGAISNELKDTNEIWYKLEKVMIERHLNRKHSRICQRIRAAYNQLRYVSEAAPARILLTTEQLFVYKGEHTHLSLLFECKLRKLEFDSDDGLNCVLIYQENQNIRLTLFNTRQKQQFVHDLRHQVK